MLAALGSSPTRAAPSGCSSRRSCRWPSSWQADLRAHPASDAVEVAGLGTAADRDLPRHRPDRHRQRPGGARAGAARASAGGGQGLGRRRRGADHDPQRDRRRPADRRPRRLRQPAPALHRLGRAQRRAARARRQDGALGLRARDHRDRSRRGGPLRDRGRGLRAPRPRLHRARAARGQRRDRRGRRRRPAGAGRARRIIRGDLHCHTTLSDGHNTLEEMAEAARARGYAYLAVTDHSASHGFGNHVTPSALRERIEEVRGAQRGPARLPAARRLRGEHPARRLARLRGRAARRARLGDRERPHLVPDLSRGR